jgi:hypothetical protein
MLQGAVEPSSQVEVTASERGRRSRGVWEQPLLMDALTD